MESDLQRLKGVLVLRGHLLRVLGQDGPQRLGSLGPWWISDEEKTNSIDLHTCYTCVYIYITNMNICECDSILCEHRWMDGCWHEAPKSLASRRINTVVEKGLRADRDVPKACLLCGGLEE